MIRKAYSKRQCQPCRWACFIVAGISHVLFIYIYGHFITD